MKAVRSVLRDAPAPRNRRMAQLRPAPSETACCLNLPLTTEHTKCTEPKPWDFLGGLGG